MKKGGIVLIISFLFVGCSDSQNALSPSQAGPVPKPPTELAGGEALFNTFCARCHGVGARGTQRGPTFLTKIYEPSHHGDAAFMLAPRAGVRAHHWSFGDMPKIEGITPEEVKEVIPYIRWLQREAGIF